MAPINRLTSLVLLATISTNMAVATTESRKLAVGDTQFTVEVSGTEFSFEFESTGDAIIVTGDIEITIAADGSVTTQVGSDTYVVDQIDQSDRRLQTSTETCGDECENTNANICAALTTMCAIDGFPDAVAAIICPDLDSLCNSGGIVAGCEATCLCDPDQDPAVCDADAGDVCCDSDAGEICCPALEICEVPDTTTGACGDPHMTGFLGQKFDFTGNDGAWYCLVEDGPSMGLNMRVTAPVPSLPQITYITGVSVITTDVQGVDHTIEISVNSPHNLEATCPELASPCLADGALTVELDGQEFLVSPGEVTLGPGVAISAVNLPGACRSFGFEKYWEHKKLQNAGGGRKLGIIGLMQDMSEWILADPTATNMDECTEYVAAAGDAGLFEHESEHALFQIMTPAGTIRVTHGRLHQLAMRDPTDQFEIPDHLTWQMNVAIDHHDVSLEATGILGETVVPTVDDNGKLIMKGIHAIRGSQEDYRVEGPLGTAFAQREH